MMLLMEMQRAKFGNEELFQSIMAATGGKEYYLNKDGAKMYPLLYRSTETGSDLTMVFDGRFEKEVLFIQNKFISYCNSKTGTYTSVLNEYQLDDILPGDTPPAPDPLAQNGQNCWRLMDEHIMKSFCTFEKNGELVLADNTLDFASADSATSLPPAIVRLKISKAFQSVLEGHGMPINDDGILSKISGFSHTMPLDKDGYVLGHGDNPSMHYVLVGMDIAEQNNDDTKIFTSHKYENTEITFAPTTKKNLMKMIYETSGRKFFIAEEYLRPNDEIVILRPIEMVDVKD